MGYQKDLDEYTETELNTELQRRADARRDLLCDYCGRTGDTPPCKFPERHVAAEADLQRQRRLADGSLPAGTYVGGAHMQRPPARKETVKRGRHGKA